MIYRFFFQAEDGIRDIGVTGVQTCALPIYTLEQLPISEKIKKFGTIKLIDSSTISMAKTYFQWAEFRSTKAGIKLHTKFNLNKGIPELIIVSNAKPHDRTDRKSVV